LEVALEAVRKCSVSWILGSKRCPEKKLAWKLSFAVGILKCLVAWEVMLHMLKRNWLAAFYSWNNTCFFTIVTGLQRMELKIAELTYFRHICSAEKTVALKKWYCHRF
jgi:hypothetical protein